MDRARNASEAGAVGNEGDFGTAFDLLFTPNDSEKITEPAKNNMAEPVKPKSGILRNQKVHPAAAVAAESDDLDLQESAVSAGGAGAIQFVPASRRRMSIQDGVLDNLEAVTDPGKVEMEEHTNKSLYQVKLKRSRIKGNYCRGQD